MRKISKLFALAALGLGMMLVPATATSAAPVSDNDGNKQAGVSAAAADVCVRYLNLNAAGRVYVSTYAEPRTYTSTSWTNVKCGGTTVAVPRGRQALLDVSVDAEVDCNGTSGQWCQGRVVVSGVEADPVAAEPSSFSWDSSSSAVNEWGAHGFSRYARASCPSNNSSAYCYYRLYVQTRNHASGMSLWLDDLTVDVEVLYGTTYKYTTSS
ncbi:MAG: hypothetical protein ACREGJ_03385 [Candidatus Saccharimonadales bacterium]